VRRVVATSSVGGFKHISLFPRALILNVLLNSHRELHGSGGRGRMIHKFMAIFHISLLAMLNYNKVSHESSLGFSLGAGGEFLFIFSAVESEARF
jgi:hypothetical protein